MNRAIVGLTGDSSKGKGTVAETLKSKGFACFPLSDIIKIEAKRIGWAFEDRKVLQNLGDDLRLYGGNDVLVRRTIELDEFKMADKAVIDGIRHPAEIDLLRDIFDAKIIGVTMSDERALKLMRERNRPGDPTTMEEYKILKEREREGEGSHVMQVEKCLEMADVIILNEGTPEELAAETEAVLVRLGIYDET